MKSMQTARKVSANTFWQLATKTINVISGFIIITLISRTFGEKGIGIYTTVMAYIGFFFMPVDFGLNAAAVKHLVTNKYSANHIFQNLLGLRLLLSIALMALAASVMLILPYDADKNIGYSIEIKIATIFVLGSILAQGMIATGNGYFQATHKYKYSFIASIASAIINTALMYIVITSTGNLVLSLVSFSISGIIGGIGSILLVKREIGNVGPKITKAYFKEIITETLPLTISIIVNLIYFRIDAILLPIYRPVEEVGKYNVSYRIFDAILVIPNYFANALYPTLLEKFQESKAALIQILKKSALILSGAALIITAVTYFMAPYAIYALLGNYDDTAILYTRILSSGTIVFFISSIAMWALIVIGKQKKLSYIYGISMIINIILNVIFIPKFGAYSSAIITIATEALVFVLSGSILIKSLKK